MSRILEKAKLWLTDTFDTETRKEISSSTPISKKIKKVHLTEKELEKIVFFYTDKTYKIFKN